MSMIVEDASRSLGDPRLVESKGASLTTMLPDAGERYLSSVPFGGIDP